MPDTLEHVLLDGMSNTVDARETPLAAESGTKHRTGASVSYRLKSLTCLLALCIVGIPLAHGADLRSSPQKQMVNVRLVASEPSTLLTSFGHNWKSYVAEVQTSKEQPQLVRFVYRYGIAAPTLPASFLDYTLVHRFSARRDEACDVPLSSMLYSYKYSPGEIGSARLTGRELTLEYASFAPKLSEGRQEVLPCYVVGPKDYKGSHTAKIAKEYAGKSVDGY